VHGVGHPWNIEDEGYCRDHIEHEEEAGKVIVLSDARQDNLDREDQDAHNVNDAECQVGGHICGHQLDVLSGQAVDCQDRCERYESSVLDDLAADSHSEIQLLRGPFKIIFEDDGSSAHRAADCAG